MQAIVRLEEYRYYMRTLGWEIVTMDVKLREHRYANNSYIRRFWICQ